MKTLYSLLFAILLFACQPNKDDATLLAPRVNIRVGAEFQTMVSSNPSTGYAWVWSNEDS